MLEEGGFLRTAMISHRVPTLKRKSAGRFLSIDPFRCRDMMRQATIIGFLFLLMTPLDVAAFWLGGEGQCFVDTAIGPKATDYDVELDVRSVSLVDEEDCHQANDATDPSSNICFEGAEHPISTLPSLITQTQAERLVVDLIGTAARVAARANSPQFPPPRDASVEDPVMPGQPLVEALQIPRPRPSPNSCSVYPESCEQAPWIPILNLEASGSSAHSAAQEMEVSQRPEIDESRRGPPNPGVGPAAGIQWRVERPPQMT